MESTISHVHSFVWGIMGPSTWLPPQFQSTLLRFAGSILRPFSPVPNSHHGAKLISSSLHLDKSFHSPSFELEGLGGGRGDGGEGAAAGPRLAQLRLRLRRPRRRLALHLRFTATALSSSLIWSLQSRSIVHDGSQMKAARAHQSSHSQSADHSSRLLNT